MAISPSSDPAGGLYGNRSDVPLVANIIDRLTIGGMENGLVNVTNGTPEDRYRHAIICLRTDSDFRDRIRRDDVQIFTLGKRPGKDPSIYGRVARLLRQLRPVVATAVGGNPELVVAGETGALVPAQNPSALADALAAYVTDRDRYGRAGRARIETEFSLPAMVGRYLDVYDHVLVAKGRARR